VCRVTRLRRRVQFVGYVDEVLAKRPQHIGADVAAQDDLAVRRHCDDQMRHFESNLLQPQAEKHISFGQHAFEGSDNICHRLSLWEVWGLRRGADR